MLACPVRGLSFCWPLICCGCYLEPLEYRILAPLRRGRRASGRLCRDIGLFEPTPEKPDSGRDIVASSPKEGMDGKTFLSSDAAYDDDDDDGPLKGPRGPL